MTKQETIEMAISQCRKYEEDGFVCSESALRGLLDALQIEWTEQEKAVATIFNRGGAVADKCGAVEAALLILSYRYGRLNSQEKNLQDRLLSRKLQYTVRDSLGSWVCKDLTGGQPGVEKKCPILEKVVRIAAEIIFDADDILDKELEEFAV